MIALDGVWKEYRAYTPPPRTFKNFMLDCRGHLRRRAAAKLTVIRDLSLRVEEGEILGVIGPNGSGKSTLAKLIAGTISADKGTVRTRGKIVPFLELGVAFNSELTGRDNIYVNGALLGLGLGYLRENIADILEFAGLEDFAGTPLKYYSSGMQLRLAFSIAMHADGDIFIFDEILAVGDESFRRKCLDSFYRLVRARKTIILLSHDLEFLKKHSARILKLDKGGQYSIVEKTGFAALTAD
ncbi:MAG: ATP-binding cassette domain-containing protein [Elusimicrobiales bacterium]|nr:ATP-binding cassette domain-containing protein [Elusimicrobiales bacterium]